MSTVISQHALLSLNNFNTHTHTHSMHNYRTVCTPSPMLTETYTLGLQYNIMETTVDRSKSRRPIEAYITTVNIIDMDSSVSSSLRGSFNVRLVRLEQTRRGHGRARCSLQL